MRHRFLWQICIVSLFIIVSSCDQQPSNQQIITDNDVQLVTPAYPSPVIKADHIRYGETLSGILKKYGVEHPLAQNIIEKFKQIYDVRRLKPRDNYAIHKDSSDKFLKFIYKPAIEVEYFIEHQPDGTLLADKHEIPLLKKTKSLNGTINTTLYDAILSLGETPELLVAISDIFQWDIDFFIDPRAGDEFKIVYEAYYLPGDSGSVKRDDEFVRYGKILAAQYTLQGDQLTAVYFDNAPRDDGYYALSGESFQKTFLKSPLNYRRISSYFSYARKHPILKIVRPHYGIDYAAPTGTPVSAAANGVIIKKGYDRGIGRFIKVRHKNPRFVTLYGHLSRFAKGMTEGKQVKQKDVIGYVGSTGLATGPHLHYTFYDNGRPINPLKIKNTSGDPIIDSNRDRFQQVKTEMLANLNRLDAIHIPFVQNQAQWVHFKRYCAETSLR